MYVYIYLVQFLMQVRVGRSGWCKENMGRYLGVVEWIS